MRVFTRAHLFIVALALVQLCANIRFSVHSSSRGLTPARIGVVWVRVGSLGRAYESSGSFGFAWFNTGGPRVHSCSRGFTRASLVFVGFFRVRVGSLGRRRDHSHWHGIILAHIVVVMFIRAVVVPSTENSVERCL